MKKIKSFLLVLLFLVCNTLNAQQNKTPKHGTWNFNQQKVWEIDKAGSEDLGRPGEPRIGNNGILYLRDFDKKFSYIFDAEGELLKKFAYQGDDKDVSMYINCFTFGENVVIGAMDKLHFYTGDGELIKSVPNNIFMRFPQAFLNRSEYLVAPGALSGLPEGIAEITKVNLESAKDEKFAEIILSEEEKALPPGGVIVGLIPQILTCYDEKNERIYFCKNSEYKIFVADSDGKILDSFGREQERINVSLDARKEHLSFFLEDMPDETITSMAKGLPEKLTYFHNIQINNGFLYIFRMTEFSTKLTKQVIDIYSLDGEFLYSGTIQFKNGLSLKNVNGVQIRGNSLYALLSDENGKSKIVKYKIDIPICNAQNLPDTHAGKRAAEVIDLLNGTGPFQAEDYINNQYTPDFRDAFPIATHKSIFQITKTMFGIVKAVDVSKTTENEINVVLESEKGDAWLNLSIEVEPEEPYRIMTMGLAPGSRPAEKKKESVRTQIGKEESVVSLEENEELLFSDIKQLNQYLEKRTKENKFSGTVLIAKDGKPVFHKAYGYASKRYKVPNKEDTKFNLGSLNKIFTTVALAQLMEKGKLSIDDPIGKYLDIFPPEIAEKVTIRHLINMRSGWGDYWGNEYFLSHRDNLRIVSDYMEFIKDIPLDFEPGTNFQHCNTGFEVAGSIIEKISGMDYFEYVKKNIYEPSGMTNTDSYHRDSPVENLAMGYTNMNRNDLRGEGYNWNNVFMMPPRGTPSGGGYSTAEDLLKYDIALRSHKLLSPEYTNFLLNRFEGSAGDPDVQNKTSRSAGAAPGICAFSGIDFQTSYSIIVLSNIDYPEAMIVGEGIMKMLNIK